MWFFFEEAITAASARRLGSFVLTESMERRPDLGFGSYDRFFPNQDTLPHGGFGNLIALPLQKEPRDLGNSVFLDDQMVPYGDQWTFLSSVTRIGRTTIEDLVRDANGEDVSSVYGCRKWRKTIQNRGRRHPRAAGKNRRLLVTFLTPWSS